MDRLKEMNKLYLLLVFIPISIIAHFMGIGNATVQFTLASLAIIPLAGLLGEGTEELSKYTGGKVGGFLNATFGNVTELIIAIFALKEGLFEVVKASIAGSMIGNTLLVLGFSFLLGGTRFKTQKFSKKAVNTTIGLLTLAVLSIIIPAVCTNSLSTKDLNPVQYENLSIGIALVMLAVYVGSLVFSFYTHKDLFGVEHETGIEEGWKKSTSIIVLLVATLLVALESEFLVGAIEPMTEQLGWSKLFVGLIILPIIGNAAEHSTAVMVAMKNKMDIAVEIAIGSSLQIILFVAPVLVFISLFFKPMVLIFNTYEIVALAVSVITANLVCRDGESNWLEGLQLVSIYVILAITFYLVK